MHKFLWVFTVVLAGVLLLSACDEDEGSIVNGECSQDTDCDLGHYCRNGRCTAECPAIYDPVCGTDGKTYANACAARANHVGVAELNACSDIPPQFCALSDDNCDVGYCDPNTSLCTIICPHILRPVCGDDGRTYANECEARVAQVAVEREGSCEENPPRYDLCELAPDLCENGDVVVPRSPAAGLSRSSMEAQ